MKKRLIAAIKVVIVLAVVGWVVWELRKSWDKIHLLQWKPDYFWLTLSALFYGIAYIPAAFFWRYAMKSFRQSPGWYESYRAYYIGHLGKYVPGKAMVVVLRAGLLDHTKTRGTVAAAAVFLETLTMMAVGAFLAALIVIVWFRDMHYGNWLSLLALGMMLASGLPILPPVFQAVAKRCGIDLGSATGGRGLNFRTLAVGWLVMVPTWLLLGLSLWASIRGIGIETEPLLEVLPRFTLAAAFSVVLGFVLMVPGGLGIREFAMAQVLITYFAVHSSGSDPASQAIVIAGVQRIVSILTELIIAALLWKSKTVS